MNQDTTKERNTAKIKFTRLIVRRACFEIVGIPASIQFSEGHLKLGHILSVASRGQVVLLW
jgi:hypothetical protein